MKQILLSVIIFLGVSLPVYANAFDEFVHESGVGLDVEYAFNKTVAIGVNGRWISEDYDLFDNGESRLETIAEIRLKFGPGNK